MRWLTALLAVLVPAATLAGVGQNRATPRGPVFGNANFPYFGGGGGGASINDSNFVVSPYLANPLWRNTTDARVTVTAVTNTTARFRVKYGTNSANLANTDVACFQDRTTIGAATENPCNIPANSRFDFVLGAGTAALNEDTRYFYQVERSVDGGTTWVPYPMAYFTTLTSDAADVQHFVYASDEHLTGVYGNSGCGVADTDGNWARFQQTLTNIVVNHNAGHNYRFYLTTGDNALTHIGDAEFDTCMNIMGKSPHLDNLCANCTKSASTQNEADARWLWYLKLMQPVTKYIPLVITLGNHEGETQYAQAVTNLASLTGLHTANAYWWFDATNSLEFYSRTARLKYFPSAGFTYDGTSGDPDAGGADTQFGRDFSLASGSFEMIITDIEGGPPNNLNGGGAREFPFDFPGACNTATAGSEDSFERCTSSLLDAPPYDRGPLDWAYNATQCNFLTGSNAVDAFSRGTCAGTTGRIQGNGAPSTVWASGAANITGIKWKFLAAHHAANSNTNEVAGKLYARGNMGNVNRLCSNGGPTPSDADKVDAYCTYAPDCDSTPPILAACCDPGESGACSGDATLATRMQGALSGYQANLQTIAKAWAAGGGRKFFFLYGHDHLSTCGQKYDGPAAPTGVYYCEGTQPGGTVDGPSWMDIDKTELTYDWGGLANQPDGLPDYCSTATVQGAIADGGNVEIGACDTTIHGDGISTNSIGTTTRGYIDVLVTGTTSVRFAQRTTVLPRDVNLDAILDNNQEEWTFTVP